VLEQTHGLRLRAKCRSRSVYSVALWRRKTPNFAVFWTLAFSSVASWRILRTFNTDAQLQTFPYTMVSKSFLYSNAFMAKSGAQTDVQKRDGQTDKRTQRFWPPRRRVKSGPHQIWRGDRGPRARSCISKTFGVRRIVWPLGGAENLGEPVPST